MMTIDRIAKSQSGFTLTELTIVLVIVALLIGGMLLPVSAQRDLRDTSETKKQLSDINEALLGFAAAQGRLPCPATGTSSGQESFCTNATGSCGTELTVTQTHGRCFDFFNGYVPTATLGLAPTNSQGYAIDAWGNPIRYAVTNKAAGPIDYPFTKPAGIKAAWATDPGPLQSALLRVCAHVVGSDCAAADRITDSTAVVLFSTGKNGGTPPISADELANWTSSGDRVFVSATPSAMFDDIITWISPNIVFNRMIMAGKLP